MKSQLISIHFLFIKGIHAREWIAPTTALYVIDNLINNRMNIDNDPRFQTTYYIMPILNPDGYEYSRTSNRMWRKNRSVPPPGSNCYGIDLNRNYDVVGFGVGASTDPCSESYKGIKPNTEAEVRAASDVVMRHKDNIRVSLSFHSYGISLKS